MKARSIRSRNLKLLILGAFSAVGCWALFFSATPINALADTTAAKKDEIIGKIAGYKTWQQVNKEPEKPLEAAAASTVFTVADSSTYG